MTRFLDSFSLFNNNKCCMPYYDCLLFWVAMVTMCFVCCGITWTRTRRGFSPQIWHILKTLLVLQTHTWKRSRGLCWRASDVSASCGWSDLLPSLSSRFVQDEHFRCVLLKPFPLRTAESEFILKNSLHSDQRASAMKHGRLTNAVRVNEICYCRSVGEMMDTKILRCIKDWITLFQED